MIACALEHRAKGLFTCRASGCSRSLSTRFSGALDTSLSISSLLFTSMRPFINGKSAGERERTFVNEITTLKDVALLVMARCEAQPLCRSPAV